jgi:hypothetical protein
MDEYISKNRVKDYIHATNSTHGFTSYEDYVWLMDAVINAPAADLQPVKHGKWKHEHYNEQIECYVANCSECGYESTDKYRITSNHRYCEYCSARMDLKDGDAE